MTDAVLGFDTSNYKTSVAVYQKDGEPFINGRLLPVPAGECGLRQNDAVFLHTKALPEIAKPAFDRYDSFAAVGASVSPRRVKNSYMPCFLAGKCAAQTLSSALHIPFFSFSHQEGHLAAALFSSGREDLLATEFLAWHLSGGTSELLLVKPDHEHFFDVTVIGGTNDLAAGQLLDRIGVLLSLPFPAGSFLDTLSMDVSCKSSVLPSTDGLFFSLSGIENKARELHKSGALPADVAYFVIRSVNNAVEKATEKAQKEYVLPVLCSGGVMANSMIRQSLEKNGAMFASKELSGDNALGIAYLTALKMGG